MATRRRFQLETRADVQRCLSQSIRQVRKLRCAEAAGEDEIRRLTWEVKRAQVMTHQLRVLSEMMATSGLAEVSDAALRAEVQRRRDMGLPAQDVGPESGGDGAAH